MLKKKFFKTKDDAEITFELTGDDVKTVALVCEFNNWEPVPMKFSKKARVFRSKVRLPKGSEFQFRYLVNESEWANDDEADAFIPNEFGGKNSVVSTTA